MADLALAAVLGPADRNSGRPRYADVVAHLYVGGSGLWQFHHLGAPHSTEPATDTIRLRSSGDLPTELAAGFALATQRETALHLVEQQLGHPWAGEDLELTTQTLHQLARQVTDLDVAVLATLPVGDTGAAAELLELPWSMIVASATSESRSTQWN